ncbi:arabinose efflux permease family protein [Pseudomonas sp. GM84]|uniref:MFS transporter n=1 Tax=Pseudomonas sp. GM84 TaxID=1144340 RepID=UPI00026F4CC7|nr:MFS transporter [Pseudomonas sp. GM84]EJN39645.1 arabinose efflux permease family protein [Pseudomonas sp. GM84]
MHNQVVDVGAPGITRSEWRVIIAASLGAVFEWYEFFLYGALAAVIAGQFFSGLDHTSAFIFALLAFAAGFVVRPIGALVFGRLGDLVGRKYTFMLTILIMGGSTVAVGLLPSYATMGIAAPIILIMLRMLQGLALGGEYGAAATYVAEHSPNGRRGEFTSYIQLTSTLGLLLSLLVIVATRQWTGPAFDTWGWRIPFLFSAVLLVISVYIRSSMHESPEFKRIKSEGKISKAPLAEAFGKWKNLRLVLTALFGLLAGQAVVWFTALFYAMFFLTQTLKVDIATTNTLVALSLLITAPMYILIGKLSDKIGRKPLILGGCLLAALTIFPIFKAMTYYANPALANAQSSSPIVLTLNPADCSFQFNPTGTSSFTASCDVARRALATSGASYSTVKDQTTPSAILKIGEVALEAPALKAQPEAAAKAAEQQFRQQVSVALQQAGYPLTANPENVNKPMVLLLLVVLMFYGALALGPMGAIMVEMFPTRIRYSAMSLPYHLGNGWFGGLLPTFCFALVAQNGNIYAGLWYPVVVAALSFVVGLIFVKDKRNCDLAAED